jgi:hypothetical protein
VSDRNSTGVADDHVEKLLEAGSLIDLSLFRHSLTEKAKYWESGETQRTIIPTDQNLGSEGEDEICRHEA